MLKSRTIGLILTLTTLAIQGCSDVEDTALEAYKCAKSADIFNDRDMQKYALLEMEEITKDHNINDTSSLMRSVAQRARDEYEPYGSSTSGRYQKELFTDWYSSSYCQTLKDKHFGNQVNQQKQLVQPKVIVENELELTVRDREGILRLDKFLEDNKGKVVRLSLVSCPELNLKCGQTQMTSSSLSYSTNYESCDYDSELGEGITFYLGSDVENSVSSEDRDSSLCNINKGISLLKSSGVYKVPDSAGWGQGWTEWILSTAQ